MEMRWMNRVGMVNIDYIKENGLSKFFNRLSHKIKGDRIVYVGRHLSRYYDILSIVNTRTNEMFSIPTPMFLIALDLEDVKLNDEIIEDPDIKYNYRYNTIQEKEIFRFTKNIIHDDDYDCLKHTIMHDRNVEYYNNNKEKFLDIKVDKYFDIYVYDKDDVDKTEDYINYEIFDHNVTKYWCYCGGQIYKRSVISLEDMIDEVMNAYEIEDKIYY